MVDEPTLLGAEASARALGCSRWPRVQVRQGEIARFLSSPSAIPGDSRMLLLEVNNEHSTTN
jgi:hypothetical protein